MQVGSTPNGMKGNNETSLCFLDIGQAQAKRCPAPRTAKVCIILMLLSGIDNLPRPPVTLVIVIAEHADGDPNSLLSESTLQLPCSLSEPIMGDLEQVIHDASGTHPHRFPAPFHALCDRVRDRHDCLTAKFTDRLDCVLKVGDLDVREEVDEGAQIAIISRFQGIEITLPVLIVTDNQHYIIRLQEDRTGKGPRNAPIPILKRVNL